MPNHFILQGTQGRMNIMEIKIRKRKQRKRKKVDELEKKID